LWLGALLMVVGGFLAAFDRRYRVGTRERVPARAAAAQGA
jgi:cytochrome c biogenesis factor